MTGKVAAIVVIVLLMLTTALVGCGQAGTSATAGASITAGAVQPGSTQTTVASGGSGATGSSISASVTTAVGGPDGKSLFAANCAVCHGSSGQGGRGVNLQNETDPARVENHIRNGGPVMQPFAGKFSDQEISALVQFVLSLKK